MTQQILSVQEHYHLHVTVRASSVLAVDVLGTGIFHLHLVP
jgi:hypothetical protein